MEWSEEQDKARAESADTQRVGRSHRRVLLLPGNFPDTFSVLETIGAYVRVESWIPLLGNERISEMYWNASHLL